MMTRPTTTTTTTTTKGPSIGIVDKRSSSTLKTRTLKRVRFHKEGDNVNTTMTRTTQPPQQPQQQQQRDDESTSLSSSPQQQQQSKSTTTTDTTVTTFYYPPLFQNLTQDICNRLWFQDSEIGKFRSETRTLILYGKQNDNDNDNNDLTGLERFNMERSTRKKTAIQLVLLAQSKLKSKSKAATLLATTSTTTTPEAFIQSIASECSEWAVTAALLQGFQDFLQVYDPLTSLLGANKIDGTTYNDSLFGNNDIETTPTINSSSSSSDIHIGGIHNLQKRKSRDFDGTTEHQPQQIMMGLIPAGVTDMPTNFRGGGGGGRRVQQRII